MGDAPTSSADGGESLLELLIAIVILGIAVVAVVGSLVTGVLVSDVHRKQTTAGATLRNYAESVESSVAAATSAYTSCAAPAAYATPSGFTAPAGYTASVTAVRYWNGVPTLSFSTSCASPDSGVQKVSLRVSSNDGRATETLDIVIRKPCRTTDPASDPAKVCTL
jgi:type II secretory pathway pseudopilin PulG